MSQSVEIFRLLYRPWFYIGLTTANAALSAALILIFVLGFDQSIFGYFLGNTIAALAVAMLGWYMSRDYLDFSKWHRAWWPQLFKFGSPMLLAGLAFYAMSSADRWFVQHYHGAEALGLYAVGAKFALIVMLVIETFRKAWWPIAMDAMHSDNGPENFRMIARLFMGLGVASVVYLTFLSPWLVSWMTGSKFHGAYRIVGILAWQSLFYGFFMIGSAGIWKAEKTYITAILMGITGVINILLNFLLVPKYGGMGAALATAVAYFFWNIISLVVSERYWRVGFPVALILGQIGLGSVAVALLTWGDMPKIGAVILTHIVVVVTVVSALDRAHWVRVLRKSRVYVGLS